MLIGGLIHTIRRLRRRRARGTIERKKEEKETTKPKSLSTLDAAIRLDNYDLVKHSQYLVRDVRLELL